MTFVLLTAVVRVAGAEAKLSREQRLTHVENYILHVIILCRNRDYDLLSWLH